ncbi:MAG: hypothetical protein KME21_15510 [Desmonostoc vinosum HA7617-LM4]|nr:hypothetical protein [Desmonostoc vinosum HA7617-LM4]
MPTLRILYIECITTGTGVFWKENDAAFSKLLNDILGAQNRLLGTAGALTGLTPLSVLKDAINAAGDVWKQVTDLIDRLGLDGSDDFYISLSDQERQQKIWPAGDYFAFGDKNRRATPDLRIPYDTTKTVYFWERDSGSDDDILGSFSVISPELAGRKGEADAATGIFVGSKKENSLYYVVFSGGIALNSDGKPSPLGTSAAALSKPPVTGWEPLGGFLNSGPDVCSWSSGRLDVFARGGDNALWHKWFDGGWSDWESLGGILTSDPSAVSWANGRIDVFARGADNALWHKWFDGDWFEWESLGGELTFGPDVCSARSGHLDVYVRGSDNALWHRYFDEHGWSEWEPLGGILTSDPTAVSWGNNRIDVFARGGDNALWHRWFDGAWSNWESLGGSLSSSPDVCSARPGHLDVYVRGEDNALWHRYFDEHGWSNWESLGGFLTSDPTAVSWSNNRIDVFVRGGDFALYHKWFDGSWKP